MAHLCSDFYKTPRGLDSQETERHAAFAAADLKNASWQRLN
jgi:hypothetical protein